MDPHAHDVGNATDHQQLPSGGYEPQSEAVADFPGDLVPPMGEICEGAGLAEALPDAAVSGPVPSGDESFPSEGAPADALRADLVTAEVAAVLSLIAHEYFSRAVSGSRDDERPPAVKSRVGTFAYRETLRRTAEAENGGCKIIAFPVRKR